MKRTWVGVACTVVVAGGLGVAAAQRKGGGGGGGGKPAMDWGHGFPKESVQLKKLEDDAPWYGRDKIAPMRPDWCGTSGLDKPVAGVPEDSAERLLKQLGRTLESRAFSDDGLSALAAIACRLPNDPVMQKQIARYRQKYINLTGLTDKEDRAALKFRIEHLDDWDKTYDASCKKDVGGSTTADHTSDDPMVLGIAARKDQLAAHYRAGCHGALMAPLSSMAMDDIDIWQLDRTTLPHAEVARVERVQRCLDRIRTEEGIPDVTSPEVMAAFAVCGADARRIDKARFEQEIAAAPYDDFARIHLRELFARTKSLTDYLGYTYWERAKKEPDIKALLFDAPEAGWTSWEKEAMANKDALTAVWVYEDKYYSNSKKDKIGCSAALRAQLVKYVQAGKATSVERAQELLVAPSGFAMAQWLFACDLKEGNWLQSMADAELFKVSRVQRGPRMAAYWAVLEALQAIRADRESYPIEPWMFGHPKDSPVLKEIRNGFTGHVSYDVDVKGEIQSVAKGDGGGTKVSFKKTSYQEAEFDCVDTSKLIGIDSSGRFVYERNCKITGYVTVDTTPEPLLVPADVAAGLAPGQMGVFAKNKTAEDPVARGLPKELYTDKTKKTLVVWNGIKL